MKKYVRRALCALAAAAFLSVAAIGAQPDRWEFSDAGIAIEIPQDFFVTARHRGDGNDALRQDQYLCAEKEADGYSLGLYVLCDTGLTLDALFAADDAAELLAAVGVEKKGVNDTGSRYDGAQGTAFLRLAGSRIALDGISYPIVRYVTVLDEKLVYLELLCDRTELAPEAERAAQDAADSIAALEPAPPQPLAYAPADGLVRFTVPAGWCAADGTRAFFVPEDDELAASIFYTSADVWSRLPAAEQQRLPRAAMDNATLSLSEAEQEVARRAGCEVQFSNMTQCAGREFFEIGYLAYLDEFGADLPMTLLVRVEDGYLYQYQFRGDREGAYYDDFLSLVESAEYHRAAQEPPAAGPEPPLDMPLRGTSAAVAFFFSLLQVGWISTAPAIIYRFAIRREPLARRRASAVAAAWALLVQMGVLAFSAPLSAELAVRTLVVALCAVINRRLLMRASPSAADVQAVHAAFSAAQAEREAEERNARDLAAIIAHYSAGARGDGAEAPPLYCTKCGAQLEDGASVCAKCGAPAGQ